MSGIAGIFYQDGRPVVRDDIRQMLAIMLHRGPDSQNIWLKEAVALGHCMLCTTPESLHEHLPYEDIEAGLVITADARIDNRAELFSTLGFSGISISSVADSTLILEAYKKWGENCPTHLTGDFVFSIWNKKERTIFCARDYLGIKPFYYHYSSSIFLFSSEIRPIIDLQPNCNSPNIGMIGEYLAFQPQNKRETFFQGVNRLTPGHSMLVRSDNFVISKYWHPNKIRLTTYKNNREYVEHFQEIFAHAVETRLRSTGPVSAHLSGGVDSSSVIAMAKELADRDETIQGISEAVSLIFPGEPCDESDYISELASHCHVKSTLLKPLYNGDQWNEKLIKETYNIPDVPNLFMMKPMEEHISTYGGRVVLTGLGGDDWFQGSPYRIADLIRERRFRSLIHEIHLNPEYRKLFPIKSNPLIRYGMRPLFPRIERLLSTKARAESRIPKWITREFSRESRLRERIPAIIDWSQYDNYAQAAHVESATRAFAIHNFELCDRFSSMHGHEWRHPFLDRRLVEFAISLPENQRYNEGWTKVVLRKAMRGILPELIRTRWTKAEFSIVYRMALGLDNPYSDYDTMNIVKNGWLNAVELERLHSESLFLWENQNMQFPPKVSQLWRALSIENWFTMHFVNR